MRIHGVEGQWVILEVNRSGYAISTGTACHTGLQEPSANMQAIGISRKAAKEFFRISFVRSTTLEDVKSLTGLICKIAAGVPAG